MKLKDVGGFNSIDEYISDKLQKYNNSEKSFKTLFELMFSENDNIMTEVTDGYRIKKQTYGEFKQYILSVVPGVKKSIGDLEFDSIVGIHMNNSTEWLAVFWSVLICGYRPLLMNTRLDGNTLNDILTAHDVKAVISDGATFCVKTHIAKDILVSGDCGDCGTAFGTEVIFMSSGTTDNVKLCSYNGENFYHQICSTADIIKRCPPIKDNCDGYIKQLVLLPLYHVFGFIAVYIWFGFFARTFVFPKDLNPQTIVNTVKKHKVTHIFAVPMVFDKVYREAMKKIKAKGDKTYKKFRFALDLCNGMGKLGDLLAKKLLCEVRDNIFGDSIRFMISGGSFIDSSVLEFFNGIGYPLANGYGMTEIGITSVETSSNKKIRNLGSVGRPFDGIQYSISEDSELLVRGKAMASRISTASSVSETDFDCWFKTSDLAQQNNKVYYLKGRTDDIIICDDGENINPVIVESIIKKALGFDVCLFKHKNDAVLMASISFGFSKAEIQSCIDSIKGVLKQNGLSSTVKKVVVVNKPLMDENDFKINRRKIAAKYSKGYFDVFDSSNLDRQIEKIISELEGEIISCFAEALNKEPSDIGINSDFFLDLGGTSLDYFTLVNTVNQKFNINLTFDQQNLTTVDDFYRFITK